MSERQHTHTHAHMRAHAHTHATYLGPVVIPTHRCGVLSSNHALLAVGRWLAKCSTTVATMDPKIAAGSLALAGANFEGLTAAWPRVLLKELSEHFNVSRKVLVEGMAKLCNAYGKG